MQKYDAAIIGSGLSGLICGTILSREGYKVCILEKDVKIGGCLQSFKRDNCVFDTGVHYIGGYDKGQNLWQYFKYLNLVDKLNVKRLDENGFERIVFLDEGTEYKYAMGYKKFAEELIKQFPKEKPAINKYIIAIQNLCKTYPLYSLESKSNSAFETGYVGGNAYEFIDSLTDNQALKNVLAGINPVYAGVKEKTPFYVHALIVNSFIESSYRLIGGSDQIADLLSEQIKANGGEIFTNTKVEGLDVSGGKIKKIITQRGDEIEAKTIISSIHPKTTLDMLSKGAVRKVYNNRIMNLEDTVSGFILYLTLKDKFLKYVNSNYFVYQNGNNVWDLVNYNDKNWPLGCFFFTPANGENDVYAKSLTAITYMNYEDVKRWEDTKFGKRSEEYEEFKERKIQQLISFIEKKIPGIRNNIKSSYASTPLTLKHYIGDQTGSLYGILRVSNTPLESMIMPRTPISNLLLTGQNTVLHGVLGATISAFVTCSQLIGRDNLLNKVKEKN